MEANEKLSKRCPKLLIVSDLDGTLLNANSELSEETINFVKKLSDMGHIFCIATGRSLRGAINFYNQLDLKTIMINYNGSYICNPSDPDFHPIDLRFSKNIVKSIMSLPKIKELVDNVLIEGENQCCMLHDEEDEILKQEISKVFHISHEDGFQNLHDDINNLTHDVNSVLLSVKDDSYFDELVYWIKSVASTLVVRDWSLKSIGTVIEINSTFGDKGVALKYLSSYYGIPMDMTLSFGDGDNDINLLNTAKYGFAMKNAGKPAKIQARHITKYTNNENGVVWEIGYFLKHEGWFQY